MPPKLKTAEELAEDIVGSGRISAGETFVLSDRLSLLQWAASATKAELFAVRDQYARAWSDAFDRDAAAVEELEKLVFDNPPGRPARGK